MAHPAPRSLWKTILLAIVNILLILLIIFLILANWWPAIYESDWFQNRYGG